MKKHLGKFEKNFRIAKKAILNCASQNHMNLKEYVNLCADAWQTLILYGANKVSASLLYAYEFYLKKFNIK